MAKFCTKCGKELVDGKCSNCEAKGASKQTAKVATAPKKFDFKEALNDYVNIIKGIFTKPVDTIKEYADEDNFILSLLAILVNCIVSGILLYCVCSEALGMLSSAIGFGMMGYADVEFFKVFLYGVVYMAVGFFVTALMIYVISNFVFKDEMNLKRAIALVGVCSVFTTVTSVVAIIFVYLSIKLAFMLLMLAGVFYLTHLYQGIAELTKVNRNMLAYVFVPTIAVTVIVVLYLLPNILS